MVKATVSHLRISLKVSLHFTNGSTDLLRHCNRVVIMCDLSLHKTFKRHFHYSQMHNTHRLHQQMSVAIQLRANVFEVKDPFVVSDKMQNCTM